MATRLAWSVALLCGLLAVPTVVLLALGAGTATPADDFGAAGFGGLALLVAFLIFAVVGALIVSGVPGNSTGPLFCVIGSIGTIGDFAYIGGYARIHHDVPPFDVLLLGLGPEGHTASIFQESPAAHDERLVFGVHGCPKPPPTRISMGFDALCAAREVWFVVAGEGKAGAVAMSLGGAGRVQIPAAGVSGTRATLWLLDEAAARDLPRDLRRA